MASIPSEVAAATLRGRDVPVSLHEARFKARAMAAGWLPHRPSWPDFLVEMQGRLVGVEVKGPRDSVSSEQAETFDALEAAGLPVYVWHDTDERRDRLVRWRSEVSMLEGEMSAGRRPGVSSGMDEQGGNCGGAGKPQP